MKYKIYFQWSKECQECDHVIIEGDTIEEIRELSKQWLDSRGLTVDNVRGSEKIEDND